MCIRDSPGGGGHCGAVESHPGDFLQLPDHHFWPGGADAHAAENRLRHGDGALERYRIQPFVGVFADAGARHALQQAHSQNPAQIAGAEAAVLGQSRGENPVCHPGDFRGGAGGELCAPKPLPLRFFRGIRCV